MTKSKPETVRLYPVEGVTVYPWPAVEFDATPEQAEELLAYIPAPFTTERPRATGGPVTAGGTYLVGEAGPERIEMPDGGMVLPPGQVPENVTPV